MEMYANLEKFFFKFGAMQEKGTLKENVNAFTSLIFEIPNMTEDDKVFNFMSSLTPWIKTKLKHHNVLNFSLAVVSAESIVEVRRQDDSHNKWKKNNKGSGGGEKKVKGKASTSKLPKQNGLMFVDAFMNRMGVRSLFDIAKTHNFLLEGETRRLEVKASKEGGWLKMVNSKARPSFGMVEGVTLRIGK
ncbi:hypothetical protein Patl1_32334 [Pistacia atlantica]|uniref:Uncharacterized protein n=1 Tax=Pistacia atlantica TaxID=434234 RepID=A0ACC1ARJ0_9ROSI|nr:hypothetical protein Patl1_32334 [Pistacia atlantica]